MSRLQIIIGSTRPGRAADLVAPWVIDRARNHGAFEVEVLDLRDWPLPMFAETFQTVGDFNDPTYSSPLSDHGTRRSRRPTPISSSLPIQPLRAGGAEECHRQCLCLLRVSQ